MEFSLPTCPCARTAPKMEPGVAWWLVGGGAGGREPVQGVALLALALGQSFGWVHDS